MIVNSLGVKGAFLWVFIPFPANHCVFGNIGVPGPGRMDNPLKVHA